MKTLEIEPLKDKRLTVYLVEKEYNEPFWLVEPQANGTPSKSLRRLFSPSIAFCSFLEKLVDRVQPSFVTEELGMRSSREFMKDNALSKLFRIKDIPFFPVDIDENARGYIATKVEEKLETRNQVLDTLNKLSKSTKESVEKEYLIAYGQCLQRELEEDQRVASFPVRENWIVMGILDQAREVGNQEEINCIHICSPRHMRNVKELLGSLNINVETIRIEKKVISSQPEGAKSEELKGLLQTMQIQAKPLIKKSTDEAPYILFYLDTDQRASSFDICMAYDAGFKAVVPYENINIEDAQKITQDAMFSRGPKGIKHTCFFIGGKNMEKAKKILETVRNTMFPPFETGTIIDPGGAYTTAAAAVAKVEEALQSHKFGNLRDKTCAIFGTGPVGRIIAVLLAQLGCESTIVSINPNRTNGKEYAESISKALKTEYGVNVEAVFASNNAEKSEILRKADVIFCASTEGVRVIEKELLENLKLLKVMADINAVPPWGIEGIRQEDDMTEIVSGIFGIGALVIGKLKYELEKKILEEARSNSKDVYGYKDALQFARMMLEKDKAISKLAVNLKFPER